MREKKRMWERKSAKKTKTNQRNKTKSVNFNNKKFLDPTVCDLEHSKRRRIREITSLLLHINKSIMKTHII